MKTAKTKMLKLRRKKSVAAADDDDDDYDDLYMRPPQTSSPAASKLPSFLSHGALGRPKSAGGRSRFSKALPAPPPEQASNSYANRTYNSNHPSSFNASATAPSSSYDPYDAFDAYPNSSLLPPLPGGPAPPPKTSSGAAAPGYDSSLYSTLYAPSFAPSSYPTLSSPFPSHPVQTQSPQTTQTTTHTFQTQTPTPLAPTETHEREPQTTPLAPPPTHTKQTPPTQTQPPLPLPPPEASAQPTAPSRPTTPAKQSLQQSMQPTLQQSPPMLHHAASGATTASATPKAIRRRPVGGSVSATSVKSSQSSAGTIVGRVSNSSSTGTSSASHAGASSRPSQPSQPSQASYGATAVATTAKSSNSSTALHLRDLPSLPSLPSLPRLPSLSKLSEQSQLPDLPPEAETETVKPAKPAKPASSQSAFRTETSSQLQPTSAAPPLSPPIREPSPAAQSISSIISAYSAGSNPLGLSSASEGTASTKNSSYMATSPPHLPTARLPTETKDNLLTLHGQKEEEVITPLSYVLNGTYVEASDDEPETEDLHQKGTYKASHGSAQNSKPKTAQNSHGNDDDTYQLHRKYQGYQDDADDCTGNEPIDASSSTKAVVVSADSRRDSEVPPPPPSKDTNDKSTAALPPRTTSLRHQHNASAATAVTVSDTTLPALPPVPAVTKALPKEPSEAVKLSALSSLSSSSSPSSPLWKRRSEKTDRNRSLSELKLTPTSSLLGISSTAVNASASAQPQQQQKQTLNPANGANLANKSPLPPPLSPLPPPPTRAALDNLQPPPRSASRSGASPLVGLPGRDIRPSRSTSPTKAPGTPSYTLTPASTAAPLTPSAAAAAATAATAASVSALAATSATSPSAGTPSPSTPITPSGHTRNLSSVVSKMGKSFSKLEAKVESSLKRKESAPPTPVTKDAPSARPPTQTQTSPTSVSPLQGHAHSRSQSQFGGFHQPIPQRLPTPEYDDDEAGKQARGSSFNRPVDPKKASVASSATSATATTATTIVTAPVSPDASPADSPASSLDLASPSATISKEASTQPTTTRPVLPQLRTTGGLTGRDIRPANNSSTRTDSKTNTESSNTLTSATVTSPLELPFLPEQFSSSTWDPFETKVEEPKQQPQSRQVQPQQQTRQQAEQQAQQQTQQQTHQRSQQSWQQFAPRTSSRKASVSTVKAVQPQQPAQSRGNSLDENEHTLSEAGSMVTIRAIGRDGGRSHAPTMSGASAASVSTAAAGTVTAAASGYAASSTASTSTPLSPKSMKSAESSNSSNFHSAVAEALAAGMPPPFPRGYMEPAPANMVFAAPLPGPVQFHCMNHHRDMFRDRNANYPLSCQTCQTFERSMRWRCKWCYLRICTGCMEALQNDPDRDLKRVMDRLRARGAIHATEPGVGRVVPVHHPGFQT